MKKLPILAVEIGFAFGLGLCNSILGLSKILPLPKIIKLINLILGLIFALISLLSILLNKEKDDESSIFYGLTFLSLERKMI